MSDKHTLEINQLFDTVVKGGYCIGCGACASVSGAQVRMRLDKCGRYYPYISKEVNSSNFDVGPIAVCPFAENNVTEDEISKELFSKDKDCKYNSSIGYYLGTYAGFVREDNFRENGSSGGMVSWILCEIVKRHIVDAIVHVHPHKPVAGDHRLFKYQISNSISDVLKGAKSHYYSVEMSEVINTIRHTTQTYAIVGVPCFIKAIRLLAREDEKIRDNVKFCIGLTCGHLKSARFADMFAWQCDVAPRNLVSIDFRVKLPNHDANNYGIQVTGLQNGHEVQCTKMNREFYGYLWGYGFFKYNACDYCDDVFAETADISFGDAWLEQYLKDYKGTNIVIIRNKLFQNLIKQGISQGRLHLNDIGANEVAKSQDAGLRHRRQGLSYRLYLKDQAGQWRPPKRVGPGCEHINNKLRKIFVLREKMAEESHLAFDEALNKGNFNLFKKRMDKLLRKYNSLYGRTLRKRVSSGVKRLVKKVFSK